MCRDVPFNIIQFSIVEDVKRRRVAATGGAPLPVWQVGCLGSLAGCVAAALTTPLDIVRTRLMTQTGALEGDRYRGFVDALRRILAEEGPGALLRGGGVRIAWVTLGGGIFFGSYDAVRRALVAG